jgi:hypothetical protein
VGSKGMPKSKRGSNPNDRPTVHDPDFALPVNAGRRRPSVEALPTVRAQRDSWMLLPFPGLILELVPKICSISALLC